MSRLAVNLFNAIWYIDSVTGVNWFIPLSLEWKFVSVEFPDFLAHI